MARDISQGRRPGRVYPHQPFRQKRTNDYCISDSANLAMATWNCGGLSKVKKDIVTDLKLDIVCLTETHAWRDQDPNVFYSELPSKNDKYSGTAIIINSRLSKYVITTGIIGSRIVYCRLRGISTNIFVIGVYIPQKSRKNPDQDQTFDQLESLLLNIKQRDCILLMGDFNSRFARNIVDKVGPWSIHKYSDTGGERLLSIMNKISLRCISTYFKPRRNHNNATFMNVQPEKPPSQIDHIIISTRWASSVRRCKTKWGTAIAAYGRKYDHGLVQMDFKIRLRRNRTTARKDFSSLKDKTIKDFHEASIVATFSSEARPPDVNAQWKRFTNTLQKAQCTLPTRKKPKGKHWETSERTLKLVKERSEKWPMLNENERKNISKEISRSARNDQRDYVNSILDNIEKEDSVGNTSEVYRLARSLSSKKGNSLTQPSVDLEGKPITSSEQQQEAWANFLEKKFAARQNEPEIDLQPIDNATENVEDITLEEVKVCVKNIKSNKSPGPDTIPAEQLKASDTAVNELHHLLHTIWTQEVAPDDFVLADMLMHYKKKSKDDRANYRALGLLNHCYKIFAMVILLRILPFIIPKLSDMQAGFRKGRGCRDNILMLVHMIQKLLEDAEDESSSCGIITYIDFTAAFDSILHSYLLNTLVQYGGPLKYCRLIKGIYDSAHVRVRHQEPGGGRSYSRNVRVDRGVIQGDIPSPVCFLVALDHAARPW